MTDFAYYDQRRTLPFFDLFVSDETLRRDLLPTVSDIRVAATLAHVLYMADRREASTDFDQSPTVAPSIEGA